MIVFILTFIVVADSNIKMFEAADEDLLPKMKLLLSPSSSCSSDSVFDKSVSTIINNLS